jgi:hypothetical protein
MVAAELETNLEGALRELRAAEATAVATRPPSTLDDADLEDRDRKEIIRILVQHVIIVERTPEYVIATVRWNDGADGSVLRMLWDAHAHRRIAELATEGASIKEMCARFAEEPSRHEIGESVDPERRSDDPSEDGHLLE